MDIKDTDPKMFEYGISFKLKILGLQEMHLRTLESAKELEEAQKKESVQAKAVLETGKIFIATETSKAYTRSVAYFEAYLNALYSLLQVVTKIAYLLYQKYGQPLPFDLRKITFGDLKNHFKNNPSHNPVLFNYMNQKMGWYDTFRNNRHKITHDGSALLLFTPDGEIEFLDYPKDGTGFGGSNINKQGLENYLRNRFNDLFDFLEFYIKHFSQWIS